MSEPTSEGQLTKGVEALDRDSRAHAPFANERTFLAWLRTGQGFVALGPALPRLLERRMPNGWDSATPPSVLRIVRRAAMTVDGGRQYLGAGHALDDGTLVPRVGAIIAVVVFAGLAGLSALVFVALER